VAERTIDRKLSAREVEPKAGVIAEFLHRELNPLVEKIRIALGTMFLRLQSGEGSPEGVVTAGPSSLYQRTDGTPGTLVYLKTAGEGNTGWTAIA
jgi:hypothetical protein